MITTYLKKSNSSTIETGAIAQIDQVKDHSSSLIWVDIQTDDESIEEIESLLLSLNCHPLAIKDALRKRHPPKIETFDEQIFILYRGISEIKDSLLFEHQQIAFFISDRHLITLHPKASLGIKSAASSEELSDVFTTPLTLALKIMHTSAGIYLDHVLSFENELTEWEEKLYDGPGEESLANLATSKARLIKIKRVFSYHESIASELKNADSWPLSLNLGEHKHFIIDLYDRFERLHSLAKMHYDICTDMIDGYISITSHQLNMTMRVLTVITAIFVPLSFLAGVYGMNFEHMPELHYEHSYYVLIGVMLATAALLIMLFKRKNWF